MPLTALFLCLTEIFSFLGDTLSPVIFCFSLRKQWIEWQLHYEHLGSISKCTHEINGYEYAGHTDQTNRALAIVKNHKA